MKTRGLWRGLVLCGLLGLCAPEVMAQEEPELSQEQEAEFQERLSAGKEAYKAERFEEALRELNAAYDINPNPKLLFNIGLIHERLGNLKEAVEHYDAFVVAPGVTLQLRGQASERLEVLRPIVEAKEAREREARAEQARTDRDARDEVVKTPPPDKNTSPGGQPQQDDGRPIGPLVGLGMAGVGVVAAATGGVLLLLLDDEMAFVQESTPQARRDARQARSRNRNLGLGLTGGGAALALTGGVIWLVTRSSGSPESALRVVPAWSPEAGGSLQVLGRF